MKNTLPQPGAPFPGFSSDPAIRKQSWMGRILIAIVLAYVSILILAPLAALIFNAAAEGPGEILASFQKTRMLLSFWNTIWIGLITVAVHSVFGTIVAWVLVRHRFPGCDFINGLVDMPFALSAVVAGYMLLLLFGRNGLLSPLVDVAGIRVAFAFPGMIFATLFVTLPFMIRELIPVLKAFDIRQEKAAATLGASSSQIFWRVTFPALRWGMIYGITLTFARAMGEFGAVLVIGGAAQGRMMTTTLFIYHALEERQYIPAYSAALLLGLVSLAIVTSSNRIRRKGDRG